MNEFTRRVSQYTVAALLVGVAGTAKLQMMGDPRSATEPGLRDSLGADVSTSLDTTLSRDGDRSVTLSTKGRQMMDEGLRALAEGRKVSYAEVRQRILARRHES